MTYRFVKRDIGKGHRGPDNGDCTVRALAMARGISWSAAWKLLYDLQGKHGACGFCLFRFLDLEPGTLGVIKALSFPAVKGRSRLTVRQFAEKHPAGSYIVQVAHHAAAIEDGVLYDRWDCSRKCVYKAWKLRAAAERACQPERIER